MFSSMAVTEFDSTDGDIKATSDLLPSNLFASPTELIWNLKLNREDRKQVVNQLVKIINLRFSCLLVGIPIQRLAADTFG